MNEITRKIQINPYLETYKGFFCDDWKANFLDLIKSSKLREPGFDLARTWEAISNARQLPWLMVKCLDTDMCEKLENFMPWDCRKIKILENKLIGKLENLGEKIRPMFRKKLQASLKQLNEEVDEKRLDAADQTLRKRDNIWEMLLSENVFHTSIWGLERMCYGGLYFNYEHYLTQCYRLKKGDSKYRMPTISVFCKDFSVAFGNDLMKSCLKDEEINIARVTRHVLAHNGGRITSELKGLQHTFIVEGEEIQINSNHTTSLFHKLKDRVFELTNHASAMPEFM